MARIRAGRGISLAPLFPQGGGRADRPQQVRVGRRRGEVGHRPCRVPLYLVARVHVWLPLEPHHEMRDRHDPDSANHLRRTELGLVRSSQAEHRRDSETTLGRHRCCHPMDLGELAGEVLGDGIPIAGQVLEQPAFPRDHPSSATLRIDEVDATRADDDVVEVRLRTPRPQQPVMEHGPRLEEVRQRIGDLALARGSCGPGSSRRIARRTQLLGATLCTTSPIPHGRRC